jgi:HPt (histidine-containing phosphotransfer) domain-containing protein
MNNIAPVVEVDADLVDLVPQYVSNRWSDLEFSRQLLTDSEFHLLSHMAHRIRGSAASYGFGRLGEIAYRLEAAADLKDAAAVAAELDAYGAFLGAVRIEYA